MQLTTFQQRALAWSAIAAVAVLLLWLFGRSRPRVPPQMPNI